MSLPESIKRIYLIGLMGAGKSTVGQLLAEQLGWSFVDLDAEITSYAGLSVPRIFAEQGEKLFREYEAQVLRKTLTQQLTVVACGGGVVLDSENNKLLKQEMTIWLELSPDVAAIRLEQAEKRPLLAECEDTVAKLREILEARQTSYTDVAKIRVDTSAQTPEAIAKKIITELGTHG